MSNINTIEGDLIIRGARFGIVVARFNEFIGEKLLDGAIDVINRHGGDDSSIDVARVPGAHEIPLALKVMAETEKYDALIALGAVIRGATPHFDYVAGECSKGLAQVGMQYNIPVGFGVLTVDSIEQAIERAGTKAGNKGVEAAMSAIEMVDLLRCLES